MAKYLPLPNGYSLKVPDEMGYEEAVTLARQRFPDAFKDSAAAPKGGLSGAFGRGLESLVSSYRTAAGAVTDPEEAARQALARQELLSQKYAEPTSLERVKQVYAERGLLPAAKEVVSQIPGAITEQLPQMSAVLGSARLGAMAGSLAGPAGTVAGGIAGAGAALLPQFVGANIQRQAAEQVERGEPISIDRGAAVAAAIPQAAAEGAAYGLTLGGRLISKLTGIPEKALTVGNRNAQKLADERLLALLAKGTAKGAVAEIPTEITQQMLERAQAGLSLTDADALAEYGNTAYQVSLLAPLGAVGRVSERAGARQEVEQTKQEAARKAAEAEEAARTTPEALNTLYDQYRALSQQKQALDDQVTTLQPKKGSTAEDKKAFQDAKAARDAFVKNDFRPVEQEYNKRRGAIEQMLAQRQAELETQAAATQPAATRALPSDIPGAQPFQLAPVPRLMGTYGDLRRQLDTVQTQLAAGPDPETHTALETQRQSLVAQMGELAPVIEQRGGTTDTQEELDKKIKATEKERIKFLEQGDFEAAAKQIEKLKALQLKMPMLEEARLTREQAGQTRELFGGTTPVKSAEQQVLERQTRTDELDRELEYLNAEYEKAVKEQNTARAQELQGRLTTATQNRTALAPLAAEPKAEAAIQPKQLEAVEAAKTKVGQAEQQFTQLAQSKGTPTPELYKALDEFNKASNELSQAQESVGRPTLKPAVLDIFDPSNIMQEALRRGDMQTVLEMGRKMPRKTLQQSLDEKASERERLINVLEGRLDAPGTKRERTDLFSQIYDKESQSKFKNGTYPDKELQELYDRGGVELVENAWVADKVAPLMRKVTTPQGNAKKSLYQQLVETAAEHAAAVEALESGIATPTMREKAASLQAKLGKGQAPAQRQMDAGERYQLQRKIDSLVSKYRMLEGKVAPIRDQILEVQNSLYKTTPVEKPSVVREKQREQAEAEGRAPKKMSRAAATAKRISAGDVRKEAETSEKMRDLALELGKQEPGYKALLKAKKKKLDALIADVGADSPKVRDFRIEARLALDAKAATLGSKTPEYKATLKEQIAYFREGLPTAGKQEIPSKRTGPVTRKQTSAPKELRVAGSRMTEKEVEAAVREANAFDGGTAYRLRESDAATTVDAAEAKKVIDGLKLPENVKFVYAPTAGDIPVKLLKKMSSEGVDPTVGMVQGAVFSDGTVLVVGDQHANVQDLEETIAHEIIGHYGIDTVIGTERLNKFAQNTDVIALAEKLGGKDLVREVVQTVRANAALGRSEEVQKLQALREIIAHTEEARVTESFREKAGRWLKEFVGMVRAGLRDMGFTSLPKLSTSDVFYMLRKSRKAFANKTIGPYRAADGQIAFRRQRDKSESFVAQEPSFADRFFGNFFGLAGRVQMVDRWAALRESVKQGKSAGVISDLEAQNAEYLMSYGSQVSQFSQQFLITGPVKAETTKKDGVTQTIFRSTKGVNIADVAQKVSESKIAKGSELEEMFTEYLAGDRAQAVGWNKLYVKDPAKAEAQYRATMVKINADPVTKEAFKKAKELYQQYNAGLLDWLVQTGVLTPAKAAELKAITYVPYYRVNKNGEVQLMIDKETPVRISNIKDEPQLQALVGGNEAILPVFTSAVQNTYMITNMGLRNQTVKETSFLLHKLGVVSRLGEGKGPAGDDVVRFKKNGKDYYAVIDTDVYGVPADLIIRGMEGIKTTIPAIVRLMGYPADVLRKFVTRMPPYAIRQMVRDPLNAWLTTGTDAVPVLSSMKELATMVAGRNPEAAKLMESGAISSNVFSGDERDTAQFIKDISAGKSMWAKTLAKADALAMQADAATRVVVYKDSIAKGMDEQAALIRTIESMNFSRRGVSPSMQMLSVLIPFFNAQIQGLDVIYRAFKGDMPFSEQLKIKEKLMARGALMALGTVAYAAMMEDDEAYKRAKPQERYSNWFVYIPGVSEPVRVPIPFELGFLFKALPEAIYNLATGDDKSGKVLSGLTAMLNQSNPFSLPQAIKPLTEVVLGKSFYSGDIESMREKQQLATDRYRENSTEVAKLLGKVTGEVGVSPISIDYLIRGYFGGLGIAIVQLANPILASDQKNIAEPSTKPSKLPLIGGLFQPVEGRGTLDEAYDRMSEIKQVKGTYNKLIEDGKRAEALEFAQNYSNDLAQTSVSGRVQKQLGELAKQERMIRANPAMTTEEKDRRLEQIDKIKIQIARQFLALPR